MSRNDYEHSRPLDVHRWSDHPEVNTFVDDIFNTYFKKKTDIFPILSVGDTIIVPGHAEARLLTIAPHLPRQLNLTGRFQVHLKIRSVNI